MAQPTGSLQVQVPSWIARGSRYSNSLDWLVNQYGGRTSDRLSTIQMRSICDSQAVPQACKATLKHQVSGLSWYLAKDEEGNEPLKETDGKGKHYYDLLRGWLDDEGHTVGFSSGVDLMADDILVARQGGCCEVIRDKSGVAQYVLHVDAATIRFTHDSDQPVYQVSPWGEVTEAWEADRFMQVRWHPNPKIGSALSSRSPVQLAYSAIAILAGTDTYNWKLIAEPIPAGILNLGPGFNRERAVQWQASWNASMQGIDPEPLAIIYGTPNLDYKAFRPPPRDMAFETTDHWYASLVAACFEMSVLDISILTKVATKAAAEEQAEATKRQGLRQLMRKVKEGIENYLLEEGIFFIWEDIDKTDEKVLAEIAEKETNRVKGLVEAKMLTEEQGVKMLHQLKYIPDDIEYDAKAFEERRQQMAEQMKAKEEKGGEEEEQKETGEEEQEEKKKAAKSVVEKGGKGSGWYAPPKGTHTAGAKAGAKGIKGGKIDAMGTTLNWESEDTITGEVVIETADDFDTGKADKGQVGSFIKDKLATSGVVSGIRSKKDIDDVKVLDIDAGKGYIVANVDITPSEEAGARWAEGEFGGEEWETYHELSAKDEKPKVMKATDIAKLLKRQAKEKPLPPLEDDDEWYEVDEAYREELEARVEAGISNGKTNQKAMS